MYKKSYLAVGIITAALLLTGAACTKTAPDGDGTPGTTPESTPEPVSGDNGGGLSGKISDMLARGDELKCEASSEEGEWTYYIKGEDSRTEVTVDGKQTNIIALSKCMYMWKAGDSEGVKICATGEEEPEVGDFNNLGGAEPGEMSEVQTPEIDFSCQKANVGKDLLTPPSNVNFVDLATVMPMAPGGEVGDFMPPSL